MKNTRRFGKVRTLEEYLMLCRLDKQVKPEKKKQEPKKYSRKVPPLMAQDHRK